MERKKRSYSLEFKLKAVELNNNRGSLLIVAQELNISLNNIRRWKKEFNQGKLTGIRIPDKSKEKKELIRLRKELADVKLERDILKKGRWHLLQERQVKYVFIQKYQHLYPVEKMCQVFRVSKSSYYKWTHKKPTKQHIRNTMLKTEIEKIYRTSKGR